MQMEIFAKARLGKVLNPRLEASLLFWGKGAPLRGFEQGPDITNLCC